MTVPRRAQRLRAVTVDILPFRTLFPAFFLTLGILGGYAVSGRCGSDASDTLRRFFDGYLAFVPERKLSFSAMAQTMICFFRAPVLAFLLGFASIGVIALPLLYTAQGFLLSFSLFCFASAMGRGSFGTLAVLFATRLLFVLPCTFLLGQAAFEKARALALFSLGGGKRVRPVAYGTLYWYRFAVCAVCLLIGCALELWLVPLLLAR